MLSVGFQGVERLVCIAGYDWGIKNRRTTQVLFQENSKAITEGCLCNFSAFFFAQSEKKKTNKTTTHTTTTTKPRKTMVAMKLLPAVWLPCIYRMQEQDDTRTKASRLHHHCLRLKVTSCNTLVGCELQEPKKLETMYKWERRDSLQTGKGQTTFYPGYIQIQQR